MSQIINQYLPWFILKSIPGIGNVLYWRLIQRFGSPENVLNAHRHDLMTIKGMGQKVLSEILDPAYRSSAVINELKEEIGEIEKAGFKITSIVEENYPLLLKHIPDPPPYLTYIGSLDINIGELPLPSISIVGSRDATHYGHNTAENLAHDLALNGFQIVSGMAIGIDTAAHKGALRAAGRTVAILGSGLCKIYPAENKKLYYKIADNGAVISEFKVNSEPEGRHFPMRNRVIAGMSLGTVVVEAAEKSGSLITARLSAEYNREVFAVPGNVNSSKSAGTHALLKQGARLVVNYLDVVEELSHLILASEPQEKISIKPDEFKSSIPTLFNNEELFAKSGNNPLSKSDNYNNLDKYQSSVLNILKSSPMHIDSIIEQSGLDTGGITAALMDLELMGLIKHSPGKMFYKV